MKDFMELPITEKFLWKLFSLTEGIDDALNLIGPRTITEATCPDIRAMRHLYRYGENKRKFSKTISYLKRAGYIRVPELQERKGVVLTQKGLEKISKIYMKMKQEKRRADGKWQMVVFDIPEKKRNLRNFFRKDLQMLGYRLLQKSIWVCPYEVSAETQQLIKKYDVISYTRIFLFEEVAV